MNIMEQFIVDRIQGKFLNERLIQMAGDMNGNLRVGENPTTRELQSLADEGIGMRILVGAGDHQGMVLAWAGDGESGGDNGAMHDTIADQVGMNMYDELHVPLTVGPKGNIMISITSSGQQFDEPRDVEDVLARNPHWNKMHTRFFNNSPIDLSRLQGF